MVDATLQRSGRIDILINNAADRRQAPLTEISLAEWRHITGIIVDGAFLCARACVPHMVAAGGGTVVNIGGVSAHAGAHNRAHVITAKAALVGLTKAIAVEFADRGITANCVVPGKIGGERSRTSGESPTMGGGAMPLVGREGTPEDVAAVVRQLCLPAGRYIHRPDDPRQRRHVPALSATPAAGPQRTGRREPLDPPDLLRKRGRARRRAPAADPSALASTCVAVHRIVRRAAHRAGVLSELTVRPASRSPRSPDAAAARG